MQIERFRGGVRGRQNFRTQMVLDCSGQHRCFPRGAEDGIDQVARGGFAVCSGDADQGNLLVEFSVECLRRKRESVASVLNPNPGRSELRRRGQLADNRDRALLDRLRGELAAVNAGARKGEKQPARLNAAGIVIEALNCCLGERGREFRLQRNFRQRLAHCHKKNVIVRTSYQRVKTMRICSP